MTPQKQRGPKRPRIKPPVEGQHPWAYLQAWRHEAGLTQEQVATMFGTTTASISRWENGETGLDMEAYSRLAKLYGAPSPFALMFPPGERERAAWLEEAYRMLHNMTREDAAAWLAMGRRLERAAGATEQAPPNGTH